MTINYSLVGETEAQKIIALYKGVFSDSEGQSEGVVIADFVTNLIANTNSDDLVGCIAEEDGSLLGCIFFSRLVVPSGQVAFILSPVAVSTRVQGSGIGQKLIGFGLDYLRTLDVDLAFTYGDPEYYAKTGFQKITEDQVQAPWPLSQPIGWLAQSLKGDDIKAMVGRTQCVEALNDPELW